VIGFSRAMVLELKAMFESQGLKVSVIYGGLSPEVRRAEAQRFRDGESDIVVATDAIGLGLNLPLDRVIFYEVDKFDGENNRPLSQGELMQIAGRAGRGPGAAGLVAALSPATAAGWPMPWSIRRRRLIRRLCPPRRRRCTSGPSPITWAPTGCRRFWSFSKPGSPTRTVRLP